jgi:hypothetical protein
LPWEGCHIVLEETGCQFDRVSAGDRKGQTCQCLVLLQDSASCWSGKCVSSLNVVPWFSEPSFINSHYTQPGLNTFNHNIQTAGVY